MRHTLEAIFRQPLRLLVLLVTLPLISFAYAYIQPRSYQASANLWALRRYEVIGATGPEADLNATPADTQATTLSELLQTRDFALTVAKATDLPSTYDPSIRSDPQSLDDALFNDISHGVQVQSQGTNLFAITYIHHNPKIAQEVVAAVIQTYGLQSQGFATFEGERQLQNYQAQLTKARQDTDAAAQAEAQYLNAHPDLQALIARTSTQYAALTDPQYGVLQARLEQALGTVQSLQSNISNLNQAISVQGSSADDLFRVLDPPVIPLRPVSRQRQLLVGGGTGLAIAILACVLYLVVMVRRDHAIYIVADLQKVTAYPVVMQLPHLTAPVLSLLANRPMQIGPASGRGAVVDQFN